MLSRREFVAATAAVLAAGSTVAQAADSKLPRVFLEVSADGKSLGKIVIELRSDVVPKTAENFRRCAPAKRGSVTRGARFIA